MVIKKNDDFAKFLNQAMMDKRMTPMRLSMEDDVPTYRTILAIRDGAHSPLLINVLGLLDALGYEMCVIRKDEAMPR